MMELVPIQEEGETRAIILSVPCEGTARWMFENQEKSQITLAYLATS